jgi:beta-lactamase regulating signal transducer with metallopeptidase domain
MIATDSFVINQSCQADKNYARTILTARLARKRLNLTPHEFISPGIDVEMIM